MGRTHPNVLKLRKQKRQGRRAYLTSKYSTIHVPRRIGTSNIPGDAEALFTYHDRFKGDGRFFDPFKNAILPAYRLDEPTEEEKLYNFLIHDEVIDCYRVRHSPMKNQTTTLVFNRKKTVLYFVMADLNANVIHKSKQYGSEDRALFDFRHNRISWHYTLPLNSLKLVQPRRGQ